MLRLIVFLFDSKRFIRLMIVTNDVRTDLDLRSILPTTLPPLLEDVPPSQTDNGVEEDEDSSTSIEPGSEEE